MIMDDNLFEGDETIVVELQIVIGAIPNEIETTVTITDNDG